MKRVAALDLARGLAGLGMIQAHAYDAYVDAPHRASLAFAVTRFVALLPLPLFMVLAGMGVALRVQRGHERDEDPRRVRRELVRRGLTVVLAGYGLSAVYGLMDGASSPAVFLRFDVLHVIGASIVALGLALPGRRRPVPAAAAIGLCFLAPSPFLQQLAQTASETGGGAPDGAWRLLLVPFVDVPPYTQMPLFPLASWCGLGAACTPALLRHPARVGGAALLVATGAYVGMHAWLEVPGVTLTRAHPVVWLNAADLGARALVVVALALVCAPRLPQGTRAWSGMLALGTGSLRVYALHLPFAYGALGRAVRAAPDMSVGAATPWVLGLMALTYALLRATDHVQDRWRAWRYTPEAP
jgi:uncharacterized membrane protein